ncbi:hypothetical protein ACFPPA_05245 [Rhodanobacter ginsengisoli]|uniref:Lipoprotein n=1 Tax=Rhodanobacter ginsengisoli TaxID=418646 RepID=A0ABW0QKX1_9GAMM
MIRLILTSAALSLAVAAPAATAPAASTASAVPAPLAFRIDEGRIINAFYRHGPIAAHLLLRSGDQPRILVAFPAGNSGVGVWFGQTAKPVAWTLDQAPQPLTMKDARGRPLRGITAVATLDTESLKLRQAVLSSIRVLRDYEVLGKAPAQVLTPPTVDHGALVWARDRLDGAPGYRLTLTPLDGATVTSTGLVGSRGHLRVRITALTGETPLQPLQGKTLLNADARPDPRARDALSFLAYRQKFLAGSWRFDTYFGRDTLMSLRLLMPVLQPTAVEDGISSVLARLAPDGEVSHEEGIGEFAVLQNEHDGKGRVDTPSYDYGMVDDDFMLAPVAAAWLLEHPQGRERAAAFLARSGADGVSDGNRLVRNFAWVVERTAAFAAAPKVDNMVGIKPGRMTGQWRDSQEGLGRGHYPYDVNAVWVPAALDAIERFARTGLLDHYGTATQRAALKRAGQQAAVWHRRAPSLFSVTLPNQRARQDIVDYARAVGVPAQPALSSLGSAPLVFNALSLDTDGTPVPVLHSDDGFALLFGTLKPAQVEQMVTSMMRPFPAGLMTSVGLLVADPAYASAAAQSRFGATAYHGTVVWSWQQAILAAGLKRQLARTDLPPPLRARLLAAEHSLWSAIDAANAVRNSELWSWTYTDGHYHVAPFGASKADADESNAAQLWSTVYLALKPPVTTPKPATDKAK